MARGITSFRGYAKDHTPGGARYRCLHPGCKFSLMRKRGNALAEHNRTVGAIKEHAEKVHARPIETVFSRPIMLHVCKDGTLTYRDKTKREPVFNGVALPVFSVDTIEDAKRIQTRFCRLQYGRHPHLKGPEQWYVLTEFSGELEDLDRVMSDFATFWAEHIAKTAEAKRFAFELRKQLVEKIKRVGAGVG